MFIEKKREQSLVYHLYHLYLPAIFPPKTSVVAGPRAKRPLLEPRRGMFTPLMASAAGYAATAYFYNLGRFKFDAEQRQDCIYQIQNMRLVTGLKGIIEV